MRFSTFFGRTLREAPSDAEGIGYQLALRTAMVRPLQAGSFAMLPLGMRVMRRIEAIMRAELEHIGAQEFRTPIVQSLEAWQRSGRESMYGNGILRLTDRSERQLIVAPTHEEAVAELAQREISSYRHMPAIIYQIHTKYRDELRTRAGLMRMREFTMLDAYSLDADYAGLDKSYDQLAATFERIFTRCGVRFIAVEASAGEMGGSEPREYMALSSSGEDSLVICSGCDYAANAEVARADYTNRERPIKMQNHAPAEPIATPNCATIADVAAFVGVTESATAKAVFFDAPGIGLVFVVIRGDLEVSETKLMALLKIRQLGAATVEQISNSGAVVGYASPIGLHILDQASWLGHSESIIETKSLVSPEVFVIADSSIHSAGPLVAGANREGYHLRNMLYGRDWQATIVADIAVVRAGDACVRCGSALTLEKGVEIGHVFKLGTHFAESLDARFLDQNGKQQPIVMGSYGIGLERLMQIIIEQHHDQAGIIWSQELAPFDIHLIRLGKSAALHAAADALYDELRHAGLAVLYDEREESAGIKFNDADLIGLPLRMLISERLLAQGLVELKPRGGDARNVEREQVLENIK